MIAGVPTRGALSITLTDLVYNLFFIKLLH